MDTVFDYCFFLCKIEIVRKFERGMRILNITVLGCGRWGSFIAWYLNKIGHNIMLWGRENSERLKELKLYRKNNFLELDNKIVLNSNINQAIDFSDIIIISISSQFLRSFLENIKNLNLNNKIFVLCMKGIEENTGKRLSEVVQEILGKSTKIAVWVGPGHVQDFVNNIPNCMIIDSHDNDIKKKLIENFSSNLIRFYYGTDIIGTEIGAAAKNVIGIAAGILDGIGKECLKGALMARGTREISRLIKALGGNELSAYGLAHLGDYQATLFSKYSNNHQFGIEISRIYKNNNKKDIEFKNLAEGVMTSYALVKLGKENSVELPICEVVCDAISGKMSPEESISKLFSRHTKFEF